MTDLVEQAFAAVRKLSPARRDELARFVLDLANNDTDPEAIEPAHPAAVLEGLEQAQRCQFASPERIEAAFRRFTP